MLPQLLALRITDPEHSFRLFIPLILVYLLLLPAAVLTVLAYALLCLIPGTGEARTWMHIAFYSPKILAAARGMEVKIRGKDSDIYLRIL